MKVEIERRYRLTRRAFDALLGGVEWSAAVEVTDVTFGPHGAESMKADGWILRLRRSGTRCALEYKRQTDAPSIYRELSVAVDDAKATAQMLVAIGLKPGLLINRTRRIAERATCELALDDMADFGLFLEVEQRDPRAPEMPGFIVEILRSAEPAPPYGDLLLDGLRESASWVPAYLEQRRRELDDLGIAGPSTPGAE